MRTQEAIDFYGSVPGLATAIGLSSRQAIYAWGEYPPPGRQYQIEILTNGVLRAERASETEQTAA
jgi:hypothetical protein